MCLFSCIFFCSCWFVAPFCVAFSRCFASVGCVRRGVPFPLLCDYINTRKKGEKEEIRKRKKNWNFPTRIPRSYPSVVVVCLHLFGFNLAVICGGEACCVACRLFGRRCRVARTQKIVFLLFILLFFIIFTAWVGIVVDTLSCTTMFLLTLLTVRHKTFYFVEFCKTER